MLNWPEIEKKWIERWDKESVFAAEPDPKRKKFFLTFPYPYINAYPHIGHFYSIMRVEAFARYKRMQGYNVLFPQGWHATGSPIISAAKRVREREEKQLRILKEMGITDNELKKFEKPEFWVEFFAPAFKKDFQAMGFSIDWRRTFHTTSLNPHYDKFIRWQFRKLKEKGYVIKKKFPVVWDPKENCPVGDHDRMEGEGETVKDFMWIKFRLKNSDLILMAGTTRPDALYGQSNLWLDPHATYKIVNVDGEKWVVGENAVKKIEHQYAKAKVIGEIAAAELFGKWVKGPLVDYELYILPANFIDANVGSGIVYSALEDPVDLYELDKLQSDASLRKKYHLDEAVVQKLKPISIIKVPEMGEDLGREIGKEFGVRNANDKKKLEEAKGELNRRVFRKGIMKKNCGACAGLSVPLAQNYLKEELSKKFQAVMFYELSGKVVSRSLTECVVKIVDDQWFIDYNNKEWKKQAHQCLKSLKLYPEKVRPQFEYVIDWLHEWACTREEGLGTRLPWDEKWLIESLSDSTIYMAYYTISHILNTLDPNQINDDLFDYIFLQKNTKPKCEKKVADKMRQQFTYWYPLDFRNSGKDLVQNHLAFFLFNHTAIFEEKYWPKGIGVNGWVLVDGQKMSKSLGNFILLRELPEKFTVDASRFTILSGGEGLDDPNWDSEFAKATKTKLDQLYEFCTTIKAKKTIKTRPIDEWMEAVLEDCIQKVTLAYEQTQFRAALQSAFFDLTRHVKWYLKRTQNEPNPDLLRKVIDSQLLLLSPVTPIICEEIWEKMGNRELIANASWPTVSTKKVDPTLVFSEECISLLIDDINTVLKLAKVQKPSSIKVLCAPSWKYSYYKELQKIVKNTRDPSIVLKEILKIQKLKKYGQEIQRLTPRLLQSGKIPTVLILKNQEQKFFENAKSYLQGEFGCSVEIIDADTSTHPKASQSLPQKPAIVVE